MERTRPARAILVLLALMLIATACERGEAEPSPSTSPASPKATQTPSPVIDTPPGSYRYSALGVEAVLTIDGLEGKVEIQNDTDVEIGPPRLYVLDAGDGSVIDLLAEDAAPVPPGARATFRLVYDAVRAPDVGMAFLRLGEDDFGAFVPTRGGDA
jgi:hypothetical protein